MNRFQNCIDLKGDLDSTLQERGFDPVEGLHWDSQEGNLGGLPLVVPVRKRDGVAEVSWTIGEEISITPGKKRE